MMYCYILPAIVFLCKCSLSEGSTHMPIIPDQHLDTELREALTKERTNSGCKGQIDANLPSALTTLGEFQSKFNLTVSPCDDCHIYGLDSYHIPTYKDVRTTEVRGIQITHTIGIFKDLELYCKSCHMVDDTGKALTGDIKAAWINGTLEQISKFVNKEVVFLFINATNVNTETVKLTCYGEGDFQSLCMATHQAGELDHMLQNSFGTLLEGEEFLKAYPGKRSLIHTYLRAVFNCEDFSPDYESDEINMP